MLKINENTAEAHFNLGNTYFLKAETDTAVLHYKKAIELAPLIAKHHENLGNAMVVKREYPDSVISFQKAVELEPKNI